MPKKLLLIVCGATASGKTGLAVALAQHYRTAVVSADSRQLFAEMSLGTARPTEAEMAGVPHYFVGNRSATQDYSVGDYERDCLAVLTQLFEQHDIVVLCGGTGLYINAVCYGLDDFPDVSAAIIAQLQADFEAHGLAFLQNELRESDPDYYQTVDLQNPHRLLRALRVCRSTGQPFSAFRTQQIVTRPFDTCRLALEWHRPDLYARIDTRVTQMMDAGLLAEVEKLLPLRHYNALNTVGYTELFDYIDGKHDLAKATALIQQHTRNYAKRQLAWFGRTKSTHWLSPYEDMAAILAAAKTIVSQAQNTL